MSVKTVVIAIGNSDDKLTQREWASFHEMVDLAIGRHQSHRHGAWETWSVAMWQSACWWIEIPTGTAESSLKNVLAKYAAEYRQDSIAWAEATTEFLKPFVKETPS